MVTRRSGEHRRRLALKHAPQLQLRGSRRVTLNLTEDEFDRLKRAADRRGTSLPNFLRKAGLGLVGADEMHGPGRGATILEVDE